MYDKLFIIYPCSSKNISLMNKVISHDNLFIIYLFLVWEKILISFIFVQEDIKLKLVHHAFCVRVRTKCRNNYSSLKKNCMIKFYEMDILLSIAIFVSANISWKRLIYHISFFVKEQSLMKKMLFQDKFFIIDLFSLVKKYTDSIHLRRRRYRILTYL